jgi:hypothetical protein
MEPMPNRARALLASALVLCAISSACAGKPKHTGAPAFQPEPSADAGAQVQGGAPGEIASGVAAGSSPAKSRASSSSRASGGRTASGGSSSAAGPAPVVRSVLGDTIKVVYYWKGDRTKASPFLKGTGTTANLDEGEAFLAFVDYINRHASGDASFMGLAFGLNGRKIQGTVVEVGSTPEQYAAAAERIVKEIKPFAAVAGTGGISTYVCPTLARAGILSLGTYDLDFGLVSRTNGYCVPSASSFDAQVDVVQRYLAGRVSRTKYQDGSARKFGFVYAEYPGLVDSAPKVIDRLKRAGVNIAASASVSADLADAQGQQPNVVARMRGAGVNTVILPDAGTPLSFLPAATAAGYTPDYVIWPCSGQDVPAQVRLYDTSQWAHASGLTCYDRDFMSDLFLDDEARSTEWYKQYRSVSSSDPASQAPYVYANLLPLVAGISGAGRDLNADSFRAALSDFKAYRYSAAKGRTEDPKSLALTLGSPDRSAIGDFTLLRWSNTARRGGSTLQGAYEFPEDGRRYQRDSSF